MTPFREMNKTVIGAIGLTLILMVLVGAFKTDSLPFIGGGSVYSADFSEAAGPTTTAPFLRPPAGATPMTRTSAACVASSAL